jgi:hypothetical protein
MDLAGRNRPAWTRLFSYRGRVGLPNEISPVSTGRLRTAVQLCDSFCGASGFSMGASEPERPAGGKMSSCATPSCTATCWVSSPRGR